uniref:Protein POLAR LOCALIZATION DURING ASYMMETRIC DIVISION AND REDISTRIBUTION n=1 Tax=Hordeum vulgare subsp. vulgare TaxID=112509 RepID=A0A8I6YG51_HORVV
MAAEGTSTRRILDYLNDGEEFEFEGPSSAAAVTPRALAAARSLLPTFRWARLARLGRKGRADQGGARGGDRRRRGGGGHAQGRLCIVSQSNSVRRRTSHEQLLVPAACTVAVDDEATRLSGLSVGLSLVFLLAKTSDEFDKMARVQAEMEALIRDFKRQHAMATDNTGCEDDVPGDRNPDSAALSCLTDGNEPRAATGRCDDHRRCYNHQVTSSSGAEMEAASRRRMDVLKEEFHAELERVRAGYSADSLPFSIGEERGEGGAEPSDDDDDDIADCRNQERIEELEAALRRAEKRLFDKEMEASLWKDTAKMAFRHDHDHDDSRASPHLAN